MSISAVKHSFLLGWTLLLLIPASARASGPAAGGPEQRITNRAAPHHRVIFLHGLGGSPQSLVAAELTRAFSRRGARLEMVVPWLRPPPRGPGDEGGPHTMTDQLARIRRQLEATPGKVVLLGHSFGAKAALKLARECPDKVSCVVGVAPSISMLYSHWKRITGERGLPRDPSSVRRGLDHHGRRLGKRIRRARRHGDRGLADLLQGEAGYNEVMKDLAAHDEAQMERGVRGPTLVIHGGQDQSVSKHYVRRFAEHAENTGVQLLELPEADHHFQVWRGRRLDRGATRQVLDRMAETISRFMDAHDHD